MSKFSAIKKRFLKVAGVVFILFLACLLPATDVFAEINYDTFCITGGDCAFYSPGCNSDSSGDSTAPSPGTGAPTGTEFPNLDPTSMANAINTYVKQQNPSSELKNLGSTIVASAQHSNISPFVIVAIAQQESSLSDPSDYNVSHGNNSFGRTAAPGQPSFTGARSWYKWSSVKASVDYRADENQGVQGGGDEASYLVNQYGDAIKSGSISDLVKAYDPSPSEQATYIPDVTSWIQQMADLAQKNGGQTTDASTSNPVSPVDPTGSGGGKLYIVGDSVLVGAYYDYGNLKQSLSQAGWAVRADASGGRGMSYPGSDPRGSLPGRTKSGLDAIQADANAIKAADTVAIELGTNETNPPAGPDKSSALFQGEVEQAINEVRNINPSAQIYWINISSNATQPYTPWVKQYNQVISSVAQKKNFSVIDTTNAGITLSSDGIHPDTAGYKKLSKVITAGLSQPSDDAAATSSSTTTTCCSDGSTSTSTAPAPQNGSVDISSIVKKYNLQSVMIQKVNSGVVAQSNATVAPSTPASTMKVIIADTLLRNELNLNKTVPVTRDLYYAGANDLGKSSISLGDALEAMLHVSSNVGANVIMKALGGVNAFTDKAQGYGYLRTDVGGYYDPSNDDKNTSTIGDEVTAMNHIFSNNGKDYKAAQDALKKAASDDNFYDVVDIANKWAGTSTVAGNIGLFNVNGSQYIIGLYYNGNDQTSKSIIKNGSADLLNAVKNAGNSVQNSASGGSSDGCCAAGGSSAQGGGTLPSYIKEPYNHIFSEAAAKYNIDPAVLVALFYNEQYGYTNSVSEFNQHNMPDPPPPYGHGSPWATSSAAAQGPFQFIPSTWASGGVDGNGDGKKDPEDLTDESFAAAKGAHDGLFGGIKITESSSAQQVALMATHYYGDYSLDDYGRAAGTIYAKVQADEKGSGGVATPAAANNSTPFFDNSTGSDNNCSATKAASGTIDAAIAAAKLLSSYKVPYVWGGLHTPGSLDITDRQKLRSTGADCSGSTSWVLHQAGMFPGNAGIVSGGFGAWGEAGEGKQMTVWENDSHVFIEFKGVPGLGHYQLNTAGWNGSGPHFFPWGYPTDGFTPRHWPGT